MVAIKSRATYGVIFFALLVIMNACLVQAIQPVLKIEVLDVKAPTRVIVDQQFEVEVTVKYEFSEKWRLYVFVWDRDKQETYGGDEAIQTADVSGTDTLHFKFSVIAPSTEIVWHLSGVAGFFYEDKPYAAKRDFDVTVVARAMLTVMTGQPGAWVKTDGEPKTADSEGKVSMEVKIGSHKVEVQPEVSVATGTRAVFTEWDDGVKANPRDITVGDDVTLTAKYKRQHLLTVKSEFGQTTGSGWYDEGSTATFSVTSPITTPDFMGSLGGKYVFTRWSGDSSETTTSASIKMDGPKTVEAVWTTDYTQPYMVIGGIAAVIIIALVGTIAMRRRLMAPTTPTYAPSPAPPPAAPAIKFCIQCGATINADATFCGKCGARQP